MLEHKGDNNTNYYWNTWKNTEEQKKDSRNWKFEKWYYPQHRYNYRKETKISDATFCQLDASEGYQILLVLKTNKVYNDY